ncbi:YhjR family protein [Cupriavidus pauculus]|uniref:YhjR family protein n=1 Tax=Cupriavidus pauculus TaxID=82633 RepID=UPI001D0CC35E|nr:YhjR family protein [Cupriavidus pauculus]MCM3608511.1 YhjR family protein [Cupriavidus pauculus]
MAKPITSRKAAIAYNDIDALAQYVSGFDGSHYFDQQGEVETRQAAQRWPLLARTMGLQLREDEGAALAATDNAAPARTAYPEP